MAVFDVDAYFQNALANSPSQQKVLDIEIAAQAKTAGLNAITRRKQIAMAGPVASFGRGAGGLVEGAGTLAGLATGDMENELRELGKNTRTFYEARKPLDLVMAEQDRSAEIAEEDSTLGQFVTAIEETLDNPTLAGNLVAEQIPNLIPGGIVGRGVGVAGKAAGLADKLVTQGARAAALSTAAAQQGADIAGGTYDELMALPQDVWDQDAEYQALAALTGPEKAKHAIALSQARKAGGASGVTSLASQLVPGGTVLEDALAGTTKVSMGLAAGVVKGVLGEATQEAIEEGSGAVASNVAIQAVDPSQETLEGVGEAAGLGAVGGALLGGPVGGAQGAANSARNILKEGAKAQAERQLHDDALSRAQESGDISELMNPENPVYSPITAATVLADRARKEDLSEDDRKASKDSLDALIAWQQEKVGGIQASVAASTPEGINQTKAGIEKVQKHLAGLEVDSPAWKQWAVVLDQEQQRLAEIEGKTPEQVSQAGTDLTKAQDELAQMQALAKVGTARSVVQQRDELYGQIENSESEDTEAPSKLVSLMMEIPESFDDQLGKIDQLRKNPRFSPEQRNYLTKFSKARAQINALKNLNEVNSNIIRGDKATGFKGLNQYVTDVGQLAAAGKREQAEAQIEQLRNFWKGHNQKTKVAAEAYRIAREEGTEVYMVRDDDQWTLHREIPEDITEDPGRFLTIHVNSGKLVKTLRAETDAIAATGHQLSASLGLTKKAPTEAPAQPQGNGATEANALAEGSPAPVPTETAKPKTEIAEKPNTDQPATTTQEPEAPTTTEKPTRIGRFNVQTTAVDETGEAIGWEFTDDEENAVEVKQYDDGTFYNIDNEEESWDSWEELTARLEELTAELQEASAGYLTMPPLVDPDGQAMAPVSGNLTAEMFKNVQLQKNYFNLLTNYFRQRKMGKRSVPNGLLQVKDLMQKLFTDGKVNQALLKTLVKDQDITDTQIEQLENFNHFAARGHDLVVKNLMGPRRDSKGNEKNRKGVRIEDTPNYRHRNYMEFFRRFDEAGNELPPEDNLVTAILYGAYSWVVENGANERNSEEDVRAILGLKKEDYLDPEKRAQLEYAGTRQSLVERGLGAKVYQALGFESAPNTPENEVIRLKLALGATALAVLQQYGLVEYHGVPKSVMDVNKKVVLPAEEDVETTVSENTEADGSEQTERRFHPFIRVIRTRTDGSANKTLDDILLRSRNTRGILPRLFSVEDGRKPPRMKKDSKEQKRIRKTTQGVPTAAKKISEKVNAEAWFIKPAHRSVRKALSVETLHKIAGAQDFTGRFVHKLLAPSHRAVNDEVARGIDGLNEFEMGVTDEDFFFTNEMGQQQRNTFAERLVNPQTNKFQRHMIAKREWATTFNPNDYNDPLHRNFLLAIAQGMGMSVDKQDHAKTLHDIWQLMTTDEDIKDAVVALNRVKNLESGQLTDEDQDAILAAVTKGKMKTHSLDALVEWAAYQEAKDSDSFTTHIVFEVDGVSNGVALTFTQLGLNNPLLGPGFGMISEGQEFTGFAHFRQQTGALDVYERLAHLVQSYINTSPAAKYMGPVYYLLGGALAEQNGDLAESARSLMKTPVLMLNFGGGIKNNIQGMAVAFADSFVERLEKDANTPGTEEEKLAKIHQTINTVNQMISSGKIKLPATVADAMNLTLYPGQREAIENYFTSTFGDAVKKGMKEQFKAMTDLRSILNKGSQAAFKIYNAAREVAIKRRQDELMDAGELPFREVTDPLFDENHDPIMGKDGKQKRSEQYRQPLQSLSPAELKAIDEKLANVKPVMHTWLSQQDSDLSTGIDVSTTSDEFVDGENYNYTQQVKMRQFVPNNAWDEAANKKNPNRKPKGSFYKTAKGLIRVLSDPGVRAVPMGAHSLDSGVSMRTTDEVPALNLHDAEGVGVKDMANVAQVLNRNVFLGLMEYSLTVAIYEMLQRAHDGQAALVKEFPELEEVFNQINTDTQVKVGRDQWVPLLDKLKSVAYKAELNKLDFMLNMKIMDQYTFEGGEYHLTVEDKAALKERRAAVLKAMKGLSVEKPVAPQRPAKVEPVPNTQKSFWGDLGNSPYVSNQALVKFLERAKKPTVADLLKVMQESAEDESQLELIKGLRALRLDIPVRYVTAQTEVTEDDRVDDPSRAAGWYNPRTHVINIKSTDFARSSVSNEMVLHEILHGALMGKVDQHLNQPKPKDANELASWQAVKTLERLLPIVQDFVRADPTLNRFYGNAVENVHELIAYGLTRKAFQLDVLHAIPAQSDEIKDLLVDTWMNEKEGSLLSRFLDLVLMALFGNRDQAKNPALAVLVGNTSRLLDTAPVRKAKPAPSLFMNMGSAVDYTTSQIFEGLGNMASAVPIDPAFRSHLRGVLQQVVETVYGNDPAIRSEALRTAPATAQDVYLQALHNGQTPFASKLSALLPMGNQMGFVAESVEVAMREAMNTSTTVQHEIRKIWKQAKVETKGILSDREWTLLFTIEQNAQGSTDYLSQFVAASLTYPPLFNALERLHVGEVKGSLVEGKASDRVMLLFARLLNFLTHRVNRTHTGQTGGRAVLALAHRLATVEQKRLSTLDLGGDTVSRVAGKLGEATAAAGNKVRAKVTKAADTIQDKYSNVFVQGIAGITATIAGDRTQQFWDVVFKIRDGMDGERYGLMASIINEARGVRDVNETAHMLIDAANAHEQARKKAMIRTTEFVEDSFQSKMDKETSEAMTRVVLRSDLAALLTAGYSVADVTQLIGDTAMRKREIRKYEKALKNTQFYDYYLTAGRALGYQMATGKATVTNLMFNATSIAYMANTQQMGKVDDATGTMVVSNLDPLISLYALEYAKPEHRKMVHQVATEEAGRTNPNGFEMTLLWHRQFQQDSAENLFAGDPYHMVKGYTKDIYNPYVDLILAEKDQTHLLEQAGYVAVGTEALKRDTADQSPDRQLYAATGKGLPKTQMGFLSNTGKRFMGSQAHGDLVHADTGQINRKNQKINRRIRKDKQDDLRSMFQHGEAFDPTKVKEDFLVPVLDGFGQAVNYRYLMHEDTKDGILERDNRLAHVMGHMAGGALDKKAVPAANQRGIDALFQQYQDGFSNDPSAFVEVSPHSTDPEIRERYRLLPKETRIYVKQVWGSDKMMVRKDTYDLAFGNRKYSLYEAFTQPDAERNYLEQLLVRMLGEVVIRDSQGNVTHRLGKKRALQLLKLENAWQEIAKEVKDIIVIKNLWTLMGNETSNLTLLALAGVPLKDVFKNKIVAYQATSAYLKADDERAKIQAQLDMGYFSGGTQAALEQRRLELEDELSRSPVRPLVDAGMFQTLVEDIGAEDDPYSYKSRLTNVVDKYTGAGSYSKFVQQARTAGKFMLMTHDTTLYKLLNRATILSDFTSRYVLYQHLTTRKKDPLESHEALMRARASFVNYDVPTHRAIQYLNDMGIVPFTKYYIRIQAVIFGLVRENPLGALTLLGLDELFNGLSDVLDSSMWSRWPVNLGAGALEVPGVYSELLTWQAAGSML